MATIFIDDPMPEAQRRGRIYDGDIFVFGPRPSVLALAALARQMLEDAFAPTTPSMPSTKCRSSVS